MKFGGLMQSYPVSPTIFPFSRYNPSFVDKDFFYNADGDGLWPDHHCKLTWKLAEKYCANRSNTFAIDIGCRDGEFTRYLQNSFIHVYCFDPRPMQRFADNVDLERVTHFSCALGDRNELINMSGGQHDLARGSIYQAQCYKLDTFKFKNIGLIKIDVEGYELKVLKGAKLTLSRYSPVIIIEQNDVVLSGSKRYEALEWLRALDYKVVATCPRGWDFVLVK